MHFQLIGIWIIIIIVIIIVIIIYIYTNCVLAFLHFCLRTQLCLIKKRLRKKCFCYCLKGFYATKRTLHLVKQKDNI